MYEVIFQNGPDAPYSVHLDEKYEEKPTKAELEKIANRLGTLPGAQAWIDGERAPRWAKPQSALVEGGELIPETPAVPLEEEEVPASE